MIFHSLFKEILQTKVWTVIDRLMTLWKSDLFDKIRFESVQAVAVSVLLYGCTCRTIRKHTKEKLNGNYTRMLRAVLNKSWK